MRALRHATRGGRRPAPGAFAPAWARSPLIAPPRAVGRPGARRRPFTFEQGWSAAERRDFYHLSLGGEIFPVSWTRSLKSVATRRPFLQGLDRFGFLDDPDGRGRLPIGLTATEPGRSPSPPGDADAGAELLGLPRRRAGPPRQGVPDRRRAERADGLHRLQPRPGRCRSVVSPSIRAISRRSSSGWSARPRRRSG